MRTEAPTNLPPVEPKPLPPVQIVQLPEETVFKPARDEKTAPSPEPTLNVPVAATTETKLTAPSEPPLLPPMETSRRKEKSGFLSRANPVNWFRSGKSKESDGATDKPSAPPPATPQTVKPESNAPKPAPVRERPQFPRYSYISPARPTAGNRNEAETFFAKGLEEQKQRRWSAAIAAYQSATRADPAFFEAYHNLALAAYEAGDLPAALQANETALALNSQHTNTRCNFALALQKANYAHDAAAELEKVITTAPGDTRAHLALANLYAQQLDEPAQARPHYLKVLEQEPRHPQAAAIRSWLGSNL